MDQNSDDFRQYVKHYQLCPTCQNAGFGQVVGSCPSMHNLLTGTGGPRNSTTGSLGAFFGPDGKRTGY